MLRLRLDRTDHVMRSVDDSPGILVVAFTSKRPLDGDCTWAVDPKWEPSAASDAQMKALVNAGVKNATAVDIADPSVDPSELAQFDAKEVVEACESRVELSGLTKYIDANVCSAVAQGIPHSLYEKIIGATQLAIDTRDAIVERLVNEGRGGA